MKRNFVIMTIIISVAFSIFPAFAQTDPLTINISESMYEEGDTIVISGNVFPIIKDNPVTMRIYYGTNLIQVAQLEVAQDGSYSHAINAEGKSWEKDGEYTVIVSYGARDTVNAKFDFITEETLANTVNRYEVDAGSSGTFDVEYTIRKGTVQNMEVDSRNLALVVTIDAEGIGNISMDLPRNSIDAKKTDGSDDVYIVLVNGDEVPYKETSPSSAKRTIKVDFGEGNSEIMIIATEVVPEFGAVAILVFAVMTILVIAMSKNGFRVLRTF